MHNDQGVPRERACQVCLPPSGASGKRTLRAVATREHTRVAGKGSGCRRKKGASYPPTINGAAGNQPTPVSLKTNSGEGPPRPDQPPTQPFFVAAAPGIIGAWR